MLVGDKYYTPESFAKEAAAMGVSKRIPFIPKNMEIGKTIVFLAHNKAVKAKVPVVVQEAERFINTGDGVVANPRLLEAERIKPQLGIFSAFIPQGIEKLIWESEATDKEVKGLKKRGITPIIIKDGDNDHY